jgi:autotransporter-associated beta strand protein
MGGKSSAVTPGGGGGLFVGSDANGSGNGGGPNGGARRGGTTSSNTGGDGGFASGGGGASAGYYTAVGGRGGFGGGGGGANANGATTGGSGGYGGGGGTAGSSFSTSTGGAGGFGGGGGSGSTAGSGGFGAGNGSGISLGGGGGLGAGGAIFVQSGGTVTVQGDLSQVNGSVSGGTGDKGGTNGSAYGSGIFFQGTMGTTTTLAFGSGNQSIADAIADYTGSGGTNPDGGSNVANQGGSVALSKSGGGTLALSGINTYSGGTTINDGGTLAIGSGGALGSGALILNGGSAGITVNFNGSFSLGNNIAATGDPAYNVLTGNTVNLTGVLSGSGDVVVNAQSGYGGTLILSGVNTYTGPTTVAAGTLQAGSTSAFGNNSAVTVAGGAVLDLAGYSNAIGSLAGAGVVTNSGGAATLTTGGDNTSTIFSGTIGDGAGALALTKTGTGLLLLTGSNTYSGATLVSGGTLQVDGSIASSSLTTVQSGAALSGTGTVGATMVQNGATFAPGNGAAGTSINVSGSLAFQSGAVYLVQVSPASASFASVDGAATLGDATVGAVFANGSYVSKRYTILTASGGVSGTFGALVTKGLSGNTSAGLSYDANDVYLDLTLNFGIPSGLNGNQQRVGDALTNVFNTNGGIAAVYAALSPGGLTQASGESGTGSQQATFNAMGQFVSLLTDPAANGGPGSASGAAGFAEDDQASAYAARKRTDAFAMMTKAPAQTLAQRWSVWAAGFGGSQTTAGNAIAGSNDATSRVFGTAVGADYRVSADTLAGFALAGGGTNFSVANGLGSGRSDLFQAGAYLRHNHGPAYLSAALAYGWQDITTDRTVTIAGIDRLRAEFNANAYSGRLEGGSRFIAPWMGGIGLTPYGAAQVTTFDLPAYAEQAVSGTGAFALSYAARSVTDTRSELGLRSDKAFAMKDSVLTLRGRLAWAHDFNPDRAVAATFQALPGASFVVSGAAQARDSALTTAAAEMKWMNGWSAAATFEGEFSNVTRSYAGKGSVRYAW